MRLRNLSLENPNPEAGWRAERLLGAMAVGVLLLIAIAGSHVRTSQDAASDFKTVYSSGRCFLQNAPAYDFGCLGNVFRANGVVLPGRWYAHAPIYPPFTFVLLAPVLALPMVPAVYAWMVLSAGTLLGCAWALAGFSQRQFGLGRGWRLLIVLMVMNPLALFGLEIGNMSVAAAALGVIAVMTVEVAPPIWPALALAVSLLLKPHLALCLLVGMCCSRGRGDRAVARRALLLFTVAVATVGIAFSLRRPLGLQMHGYMAMLASELQTGSMNPGNHQRLPIEAEITAMHSLLGYFGGGEWPAVLSFSVLAVMAALLVAVSRSPASKDAETRPALLGAWIAFGLMLTYHRSHDGILLLVLLPWMLAQWRKRGTSPIAWGVLVLLAGLNLNVAELASSLLVSHPGWREMIQFLLCRQAALATLGLEVLLLGHVLYRARMLSHAQPLSGVASRSESSIYWGSRV